MLLIFESCFNVSQCLVILVAALRLDGRANRDVLPVLLVADALCQSLQRRTAGVFVFQITPDDLNDLFVTQGHRPCPTCWARCMDLPSVWIWGATTISVCCIS